LLELASNEADPEQQPEHEVEQPHTPASGGEVVEARAPVVEVVGEKDRTQSAEDVVAEDQASADAMKVERLQVAVGRRIGHPPREAGELRVERIRARFLVDAQGYNLPAGAPFRVHEVEAAARTVLREIDARGIDAREREAIR